MERKHLTDKEFRKLITTVEKTNDKYALRDKLIFLVAVEAGLRGSEIGNLKVDNFNGEEIYCKRLKNSRSNTVRLSKTTAKALKKYISDNDLGQEDYIFSTRQNGKITTNLLNKMCHKYFELAKLPMELAHPHTFKHTCGVLGAEAGLDLRELNYLLGHKRVENTMIYYTFTTKQSDEMYRKLGR